MDQYSNQLRGPGGRIAIIYGRPRNALPDTSELEQIELTVAQGKTTRLFDVTGDGAPELVTTCGMDLNRFRIFAGRPGQRLLAQYGSGNDAPLPGRGWWSRPWLEFLQPPAINDCWTVIEQMSNPDLGDGNIDGLADIWTYSAPFFVCYTTGGYLDQWIDGYICVGGVYGGAVIGDIDGSGMPMIAIHQDQEQRDPIRPFPGAIIFFKPDTALPTVYRDPPLRLPDGVTRITSADGRRFDISIRNSRHSGAFDIDLTDGEPGRVYPVRIVNQLGQSVEQLELSTRNRTATLQLPRGLYFLSITSPDGTSTKPFFAD